MIANLNSIGRELLDNQNQEEEEDNTVGNYLEGLFNYDQLVSNPIQPTLQEIIQNKENNYMPTYSSRSDNYVFDDNFGSAGIKFDKAKNRWYSDDPLTNAFIMKESGGYADALSPTGASGLFQFTVGTARAMGLDPKDRTDPYKSYDAYVRLMKDNARILRSYGIPVTPRNLYFIYNIGPKGAKEIIQAENNPDAKLSASTKKFIQLNGASTADEYIRKHSRTLDKYWR